MLVSLIKRRPLGSAIALLAVVGTVVAAGFMAYRRSPEPSVPAAPPTLESALALLDEGQDAKAAAVARKLVKQQDESHAQDGGPYFVLGASAFQQAQKSPNPRARRDAYLKSVRALQKSYDLGFPEGRGQEGLRMLASSLQELGRSSESIPLLDDGLNEADDPRLRWLRAWALREADPPALGAAIRDLETALQSDQLPQEMAVRALRDLCRMHALRGDLPAARESWEQLPEELRREPASGLLEAWLSIREAEQALDQGSPSGRGDHAAAAEKVRSALDTIELIAGASGLTQEDSAAAEFLTGLAQRRLSELGLGDPPPAGALEWLARTRQVHSDRPEGLAAAFHEAEILSASGNAKASLSAWKRFSETMGGAPRGAYPWLTTDQMRIGLRAAHQKWLARGEFEAAAALAGFASPLFARSQSLQMRATTLREWAQALAKQSRQTSSEDNAKLQAESRKRWREAGQAFLELAEARKSSRQYPQDLWDSAAALLAGHDFRKATRLLREYLDNERGANRPPGLVAMSEAQLSLRNYDAALAPALECLEFYSRHPLSYRARLLASHAYEEKGDLPAAQKMLEENLYGDALTPASPEWRDSLFALGSLLYRKGAALEARSRQLKVEDPQATTADEAMAALEQSYVAFGEAARRLEEAVAPERYPTAPQATNALYMLAEAHRQRAKWSRRRLKTATVEAVKVDLERRQREDLSAAVAWYDVLRQRLDRLADDGALGQSDQALERNTYFHRADALFDLANYEEAVKAYYSAANRYHDSPAALEAFVQIAACQRRLGKWSEAKGTLNQAKAALGQMPEADFARLTRYSRDEWTQLLNQLGAL